MKAEIIVELSEVDIDKLKQDLDWVGECFIRIKMIEHSNHIRTVQGRRLSPAGVKLEAL